MTDFDNRYVTILTERAFREGMRPELSAIAERAAALTTRMPPHSATRKIELGTVVSTDWKVRFPALASKWEWTPETVWDYHQSLNGLLEFARAAEDWPTFREGLDPDREDAWTKYLLLASDSKSMLQEYMASQKRENHIHNLRNGEPIGANLVGWYLFVHTTRRSVVGWVTKHTGNTLTVRSDPLSGGSVNPMSGPAATAARIALNYTTDSFESKFTVSNTKGITLILPPEFAGPRRSWVGSAQELLRTLAPEAERIQKRYRDWGMDSFGARHKVTSLTDFRRKIPEHDFSSMVSHEPTKTLIKLSVKEWGPDLLRDKLVEEFARTMEAPPYTDSEGRHHPKSVGPITTAEQAVLDRKPLGADTVQGSMIALLLENHRDILDPPYSNIL